jgi:DNA-binding ferritin-like protein
MKSAILENPLPSSIPSLPDNRKSNERQLSIDQLARAVGEHALRQVEIDQRMATRILELRDELNAAKDEIRSLHAQVEQLIQGISQGIVVARSQSARATQNAFQSSAAGLRNR